MSRPFPATAQRDPLRAMFLCLVVLAQLLLPSTFAQARAAGTEGCVAVGKALQDGKSKQSTHVHGQECAHCRPQVVVLSAPIGHPQISVAPVLETVLAHGDEDGDVVSLQPVPPATGPPVRIFLV